MKQETQRLIFLFVVCFAVAAMSVICHDCWQESQGAPVYVTRGK